MCQENVHLHGMKVAMEPRQVFDLYQRQDRMPLVAYRYCPLCGGDFELETSGSGSRYKCQRCGYILYQNPSPGVVAVIVEHEKVLLGKRARGVYQEERWGLPGGFIECNENFLSAAHREVMEETGLSVELQSILSVISNFLKPGLHTLVIVLLAKIISGDLSPGDDIAELSWFPCSGPFPNMAFPADRHVIERYHETRIKGALIDPRFAFSEYTGVSYRK
jgi:8-oxo-dGTP diphosphatase